VTVGNNVQVWDVAAKTMLVSLSGHTDAAGQVAFSPDGKSLVSSGADNQLFLWQVLP
jgi:WD40 repeat protein